MEGEADLDGDGHITVDELYDYAYEKVKLATPKQTPSKFSSKQQGEIVLRQSMRIEDIKPVTLPNELIEATEDSRTFVREGAVQQLEKLLKGRNLGLARSAREVLERMEREDDSRRVSQMATQLLESIRQAEEKAEEERKAREDAERLEILKAEEERLARERAEAARKAIEEAERLAEEKRLALEQADAERRAIEETERLLAEQKAEEERKAREEAERLLAEQKAEEERIARDKMKAERLAAEKAKTARKAREEAESRTKEKRLASEKAVVVPQQLPILIWAIIGIIGLCIIATGVWGIPYLAGLIIPPATPAPTEPPATEPPATEAPATGIVPELVVAAQAEGVLTTIALPHDWCNYGTLIQGFKDKYGIEVNELDPGAGSGEEVEAIRANKDNRGPQAPDVVDIGLAFVPTAKDERLLIPYKVSTWNEIPDDAKDPDGYWYGDYYGVLSFSVNTTEVANPPAEYADLLKPEYNGQVALSGDPLTSNAAALTVWAAGLATGATGEEAVQAGLEFFKSLNEAGNFVPIDGDSRTVGIGETPILIDWSYNSIANDVALAGNPDLVTNVPKAGRLAGVYVQAISAYGPHPNAAKLWMEYLYSDEGQLGWASGFCHPIRFETMSAAGTIPEEVLAQLPSTEGAYFPTIDEINAAKAIITEGWPTVVGINIQQAP